MADKKERLKKHIEALEKSYDNILTMLKEDITLDEKTQKVALKDSQRKIYAEGIDKASSTANDLLEKITIKEAELEELEKGKKSKKDNEQNTPDRPEEEEKEENKDYPIESYLK